MRRAGVGEIQTERAGHWAASKRRRASLLGAILLGVALLAAAGLYRRYYGLPRRFAVVESGILYRSGQPKPGELDHLVRSIGLRTLIIAREADSEHVRREIAHARARGLNIVHLPIEGRRPIPEALVDRFFRVVDDPAARPVLVHCSAGRHRTGYLCALYRVERQGWSVQRAIDEMRSFDPDMEPDRPVLQQLRHYQPARASPAATAGAGPPP